MTIPILLQAGIPALIKGLAEGLKALGTPAAQGASSALDQFLDGLTRGQVSPEQLSELNRHVEKMQEIEADERKSSIEQINESLRAEVASTDPYVRRMRPTFGYIIAITWMAQMLSIAYVIVFETEQAALVIEAVQSLGTIWAVGLSVLGIYVYKRSEEKKMDIYSPASPLNPINSTKKESKKVVGRDYNQ